MAELSLSMGYINCTPEERKTVADILVKLKIAKQENLQTYRSGQMFYMELDISELPMPLKKHMITAGIIQGNIFEYSDAVAYIKSGSTSSNYGISENYKKKLNLYILSPTIKAHSEAAEAIESLLNEVTDPKYKLFKMQVKTRPFDNMLLKSEFEIKTLQEPVINYVITKGIILGEIYNVSGAVVCTRGSPYLSKENNSARPLYLLIQGPTEISLWRAAEKIKKLIAEASTTLFLSDLKSQKDNADNAELLDNKTTSSNNLNLRCDTVPSKLATQQTYSISNVKDLNIFQPESDQNNETKVKQCVILVQWLLAHPLLVTFLDKTPDVFKVDKASETLAVMALTCLVLYNQFSCTHSSQQMNCSQCSYFFRSARKETLSCCMDVLKFGFNIPKLIIIDNYIKSLSSKEIGVLYDYVLPKNLFNLDNCRLFIDLVINCGFNVRENDIEKYLRSTKQWYPLECFQHLHIARDTKCAPHRNPKTHYYPYYSPSSHCGGLINFKCRTIKESSSDDRVKPNASNIPMCRYFPFLEKLSASSNLYSSERYKNSSVLNKESNKSGLDIERHKTEVGLRPSEESSNNKNLKRSLSPNKDLVTGSARQPQNISDESGESSSQPLLSTGLGMPTQALVDPFQSDNKKSLPIEESSGNSSTLSSSRDEPPEKILKYEDKLPPSFLAIQKHQYNYDQKPSGGHVPNPVPPRKLRKIIRKQKEEEKRKAIAQAVSAWTLPPDVQLSNTPATITGTQPTDTQLPVAGETNNPSLFGAKEIPMKQLLSRPPKLSDMQLPNTPATIFGTQPDNTKLPDAEVTNNPSLFGGKDFPMKQLLLRPPKLGDIQLPNTPVTITGTQSPDTQLPKAGITNNPTLFGGSDFGMKQLLLTPPHLSDVQLTNETLTGTQSASTLFARITNNMTDLGSKDFPKKQLLLKPPQLILPNTTDNPFSVQEPLHDSQQQNAFSDVINKLQEFLQSSSKSSEDAVNENISVNNVLPGPESSESVTPNINQVLESRETPVTLPDQIIQDPQPSQDTFSSVLLKLQQFINQNENSNS